MTIFPQKYRSEPVKLTFPLIVSVHGLIAQKLSRAKPEADVNMPDLLQLALGGMVEIPLPEMWLLRGAAQHPSCAGAV